MRFLQARGQKSKLFFFFSEYRELYLFIQKKLTFLGEKMLETDYNCDKDSCNDYFKMEWGDPYQ